jgi:hypothetical protein
VPDGGDQHGREHADRHGHGQVEQVGALVEGQSRHRELELVEPAPVAEPDEQQVADRRRDESRQQQREQRRADREPALQQQQPGDERPAEQRRDRRERAGRAEHRALARRELRHPRRRHADGRPERDQRRLRAEHRAERQRAERRERDPGRVLGRRRCGAHALQRRVPAVAGQQAAGRKHQRRAHHRQADHEVPGRLLLAERVWQLLPHQVLELVHEREEDGGDERRRDADQRADRDQAQVGPTGRGRVSGRRRAPLAHGGRTLPAAARRVKRARGRRRAAATTR